MNPERLREFSRDALIAAGSDPREAAVISEILVWCDSVGRPNQGVWRLPVLCERLLRGLYESPCQLDVCTHGAALASVDGSAGQGHYVAAKAMEHAIAIARAEGICAVTVSNSNFYGAGGYYAAMAARENMIGVALSNSFPKVRAANGRDAVLGTNPLAFACPARPNEPLVLDMATSELAGSTVRKRQEQGEKTAEILDPLGGAKGYGLALMVEVLAGVLANAGFSHDVKSMYKDFEHAGNNGHFFLAMDIQRFMPAARFEQRMLTLIEWLSASGDKGEVNYPGEQRWRILKETEREGITLDASTKAALNNLGKKLGMSTWIEPAALSG